MDRRCIALLGCLALLTDDVQAFRVRFLRRSSSGSQLQTPVSEVGNSTSAFNSIPWYEPKNSTENHLLASGVAGSPVFQLAAANSQAACSVSAQHAQRARAQCKRDGVLNYPVNPCRTIENPSVGKVYQLYYVAAGGCGLNGVTSSRCDEGLSATGTSQCPITKFDGMAPEPQFYNSNLPTGENLTDPISNVTIPSTQQSDCGLLLTLTGAEEPTEIMKTQLQVAQIAVCDYLKLKKLPLPKCYPEQVNATVAARNVEIAKDTPSPRAWCEVRLNVPPPLNATGEDANTLSISIALAALSEICTFADWWKTHPGYKKGPSCKINHGGAPLLAGLMYTGKARSCPWTQGPTNDNDVLGCLDGSFCDANVEGWECCLKHGGRAQCPNNFPFMCEAAQCGGSPYVGAAAGGLKLEHCCLHDCSMQGGQRKCEESTMVAPLSEANLDDKVARSYQLGFPGALMSILNAAKVQSGTLPSYRTFVMQQTYLPVYCTHFSCIVDQMLR